MSSINQTRVSLRRIYSKMTEHFTSSYPTSTTQFHLVPSPQPHESFYFNQEPISASIQDSHHSIQAKMDIASVHLTDQRLVLLLQDHSSMINSTSNSSSNNGSITRMASTFQIDLSQVASLKCKLTFRCGINLSLNLVNSTNAAPVRIQLIFEKRDRNRRDAFKEYLNMIMAGLFSRKRVFSMHQQLPSQLLREHEQLPSYNQALSDTTLVTADGHRRSSSGGGGNNYHNNNNNNGYSTDIMFPPAYSTTATSSS
ncbi:hypothetical protein BDA99DRAFT_597883 [Phascolomyces articulosus]|uniref:Uncharacterized protein n=1 Tax=Phascolomyces articulosus TaxID=60185 RepID=A0AAD5KE62_9FUNG|nr:hypothetical protein BDA99DRAFT_597883 [Phascolomyces articulosus]